MSIPKIIHYCWFGGNEKTEDVKKYIATWKKYCPDYKIIEWNESNFDVNLSPYTSEAYKMKKWAFVSDFARLYALVSYGGIYMDTDVELLKPLDSFLQDAAFIGFENKESLATAIIGCNKENKFFKDFLSTYYNEHFVKEDNTLNLQTNTNRITKQMQLLGLQLNDSFQTLEDISIYPHDYFCPKDYYTEKIKLTENTIAIHHFTKSWCDKERTWQRYLRMHPKFNSFIHIPNKIGAKLLGKHYQNLKHHLKGGN